MENYGAIVSLSGGLDSAVLLGDVLEMLKKKAINQKSIDVSTKVLCVAFNYGSKHNRYENHAAANIADHYGDRTGFELVDLRGVMNHFKSVLLQDGGDIPEGHYEEESMRQTVVPGRNLIFLSILAGLAESYQIPEIYIGAHAGDHNIYPDCRPIFLQHAAEAIYHSSDGKVRVVRPYEGINKQQIVSIGLTQSTPFFLTRTCYKAQPVACGKCGSCQERLEAFQKNGVVDPIDYESRELLPKK